MMERHLLRYFLAVVDTGTFSRAAAMCRVSQPTVSSGIARLEQVTGQLLFHRSNRRVELTAAGARLVPHARRIEGEFLEAQQAMSAVRPSRLIRIGLASTIAPAMVEAVMRACTAQEGVRLELVERRPTELGALLDRGRVDFLFGPFDGDQQRKRIALFTEPYRLVLPQSDPLAARAELQCEDLVDRPMLVRRQCEALPLVSQFFTARGIRPFMAARTADEERIASYVRQGLGLTVMPRSLIRDGMVDRPLAGFALRRTVGLTLDPASEHRLADNRIPERITAAIAVMA